MRHSILTFALVALSIVNINATNTNKTLNTSIEVVNITKNAIAQVFEWQVKTNKGAYAGTALSLKEAEKLMTLSTSGEIVMSKSIQSYFVLKSEINKTENRNYFWEVETKTGKAKGYASNKAYAEKMIALVATGDAVVSKIIISQPQQ
ncbi:hypothetical protein PK35_13610 [Tamlana nanhaiensis]|uniref:DUF4430 domain-containing protein n=1 Tax=Neotamlana nanhaiensis TaxID=1382798 RepID=A0A0D7VY71_9FLAO|nr:hypothetical protein [Tamlana nanhaiensis]KJD31781.1 hypothetical protein PK35_13610 [Tamlana nanhaiensis]